MEHDAFSDNSRNGKQHQHPGKTRRYMQRIVTYCVVPMSMLALVACGGGAAAEPTALPTPIAIAQPTDAPLATISTEEPTEEPTEAALPTEEATAEIDVSLPTEASTEGGFAQIVIGDLGTYTHKDGLFTIDVPINWNRKDLSTDTEALVRWSDENDNGVILADVFEMAEKQTDEQLTTLLQKYLDNTYQDQPNFHRDDPQPQKDGSVLIVWNYTVKAANVDVEETLLGNTFIQQHENKIELLTFALPDTQFDGLKPSIDKIINSFKIDPSVAMDGSSTADSTTTTTDGTTQGLAQVVIGDLETYTYPGGLFTIDVPVDWTATDNSKPGEAIVLWTDKTNNGLIVTDVFEQTTKQSEEELSTFLKDFLTKTFKDQADFEMDEAKPQADGSVLVVWSYTATTNDGIKGKLLGNSFIEQRDDKVSIQSIAVPDEQFDGLVSSLDKVINSYKIDSSAKLP